MNTLGCISIQVWSVWHAENFYKSLGFRNILEYPSSGSLRDGRKPRKVEGEFGPHLVWNADPRLIRSEGQEQLRHHESLSSLRSVESHHTMRSKESLMSLRGGVGAIYQVSPIA